MYYKEYNKVVLKITLLYHLLLVCVNEIGFCTLLQGNLPTYWLLKYKLYQFNSV